MARCFLVHLRAHLPGVQIPAPGMIPCGVRPTPYIYFDSKLTTYAKLNRLNQMGITFMTLRRRSPPIPWWDGRRLVLKFR